MQNKLIDTHCHLYSNKIYSQIDEVILKSKDLVEKIIMPNIDEGSMKPMLEVKERFGDYTECMNGLHPCMVSLKYRSTLKNLEKYFENHDFIAIGEIGIDLHWDKENLNDQIAAFEIQLDWAQSKNLPVVIHCREAFEYVYRILKRRHNTYNQDIIIHCFSEGVAEMNQYLELNCKFGIGGIITFNTSDLSDVIKSIPSENIVLETDSPYLAPVPYRGKLNLPYYLDKVVEKISESMQIPIEDVAKTTTENAKKFYRLGY